MNSLEVKVRKALAVLAEKSQHGQYDVFTLFQWPDHLDPEAFWISPELLSVHNSEIISTIEPNALVSLSHMESMHFYSLNVHGIRELLLSVMEFIYQPQFLPFSDYLSHFIAEENKHMWFFSQLCLRYGNQIYRHNAVHIPKRQSRAARALVVFFQIYIFEQIGHYFNRFQMNDTRLPEIFRAINRQHYIDETRHLGMGNEILLLLAQRLHDEGGNDELQVTITYLSRYVTNSIETLYNPQIYRTLSFERPLDMRNQLLSDPGRKAFHRRLLEPIHKMFDSLNWQFSPLYV